MNASLDSVRALLTSAEFLKLWETIAERHVSWEEFKTFDMPFGVSPEELWELMVILRRRSGYELPFVSYLPTASGAELVWYSIPHKTQLLLQRISEESNGTSWLTLTILDRETYHFQIFLMFNEFLSALRRDGITIEPSRARELWLNDLNPETPGEVVFLRLCDTFLNVLSFAKKQMTRGTIENLYDSLCGDDEAVFQGVTRLDDIRNQGIFTTNYTLDIVCELANSSSAESLIHPVISGISIAGLLWDHKPLPQLNASVGLLILKLLYYKSNYPALAYLPFSRACEEWEQGVYDANAGLTAFVETLNSLDCGQGLDSTSFHASALALHEYELKNLKSRIEGFLAREQKRHKGIAASTVLNTRQKSIIFEILKNPVLSKTIEEYCGLHHIAYSTGRKDLIDLAEQGYLVYRKNGFAFEFSAGPMIKSILQTE